MPDKRHPGPILSTETLASGAEGLCDRGEISFNQAKERSGIPVAEHTPDQSGALPGHVNSIGHQATAGEAGLELVTDGHIPQTGARREARSTKSRKARSWRERLAADQAPPSQRVTPLGHNPHITSYSGGRAQTVDKQQA